jgi:polyhydroxyalkanoate synthesis regulator phasin
MTQPKKPARSSSARKRGTTAKSSSRSTSSARSASPRAKAAASKGRTTRGTSSKGSPAKAPARAGAKPTVRKPAVRRPTSPQDVLANLGALRERLLSSITLSPDRLQETVDDAVRRGRMTRRDAEELLTSLVAAGRQQTEALLSDLEQLLGRGAGVRDRASRGGDAVLRRVDRARRQAGVPGFPITSYDELNASQITKRLDDLTPAQLRKVRDHERRNDNRKSILQAIERKLK